MDNDRQMAMLVQTWRVVDILGVPASKDIKLCADAECCNSEAEFTIEQENWTGIESKAHEFYAAIADPKICDIAIDWEWKSEHGHLHSATSNVEINENMEMMVQSLVHGESNEFMSIFDVQLKVTKSFLIKNK